MAPKADPTTRPAAGGTTPKDAAAKTTRTDPKETEKEMAERAKLLAPYATQVKVFKGQLTRKINMAETYLNMFGLAPKTLHLLENLTNAHTALTEAYTKVSQAYDDIATVDVPEAVDTYQQASDREFLRY